jgi:hypothetical protein
MSHGDSMFMIAHIPEQVFWLWLSGVVFLVMAVLLIMGPYKRERSDLMNAFLGFLLGMGAFHVLGGASMLYEIPILMYIAALCAITGSVFVFKFPLSELVSTERRKTLFNLALLIGWVMVGVLLFMNASPMLVMNAAAIFMIVVSGAISGFYMVVRGLKINDPATKIKCIGGGCSIVLCCLVTHLIVILIGFNILAQSFMTLAKVFMVLTPITLVLSVLLARRFVKGS